MKKSFFTIAALAAATVFSAPAAYANVTCVPGSCVITGTSKLAPSANFTVSPSNVGPTYRGPISANLGNTVTTKGAFTDTFNFVLPAASIGGAAVTTLAASFHGATDLDFTSVLVNGVAASIAKIGQGMVEVAFAPNVSFAAGPNSIVVNGLSRGNGSYGGSVAIITAVPELATWGMMIIGFFAVGGSVRRTMRKSDEHFTTKVRAIAAA